LISYISTVRIYIGKTRLVVYITCMNKPTDSTLGEKVTYSDQYDAGLLFPIPRKEKRDELGISDLTFHGVDQWSAYEVSWLTPKGKPQVRIGQFIIPCESENIVESKSFKLYLNSFNQTKFKDEEDVIAAMTKDLSEATKAEVRVILYKIGESKDYNLKTIHGICIDDEDIKVTKYELNPKLLNTENKKANETLYSHLFKSNCLVTNQPDWASIVIRYEGAKINHASLLEYIISFRKHNEFHEQCVERIFTDIMKECSPEKLTVFARFTRRGGLDINPFRSNFEQYYGNLQLPRQ
jgi:7-cyano-7-deazaguanine reductase